MKVFLSSTAQDLDAYRKVADDTILRLSQQTVLQQLISWMAARFFEHHQLGFMTQPLQHCQLFIQKAGPLLRSWLAQLLQPMPT